MSRDYIPHRKACKLEFNSNMAGSSVLGDVSLALGIPCNEGIGGPRAAWEMDEATAKEAARKLREGINLEAIRSVYDNAVKQRLEGGTFDEFKIWLLELAEFLDNCGGYTCE